MLHKVRSEGRANLGHFSHILILKGFIVKQRQSKEKRMNACLSGSAIKKAQLCHSSAMVLFLMPKFAHIVCTQRQIHTKGDRHVKTGAESGVLCSSVK